jgi:ComF family protein
MPGLTIGKLARAAADFVFPPACLWCGREANPVATAGFCPDCETNISPPIAQRCARCSAPVGPFLTTVDGCIHCRTDTFSFRRAISLGPYDDQLRRACLRCKRPGHSALSAGLARLLCEREAQTLRAWNCDAIVPVPHFWVDRLRQTDHAADSVADQLGRFLLVPVERHILAKVKWTPKQLHLSASARRRNLQAAFRLAGAVRLDGLRILLADDILTTGTTAHRVSRVLLDAGAEQVCVAVLARGIGA